MRAVMTLLGVLLPASLLMVLCGCVDGVVGNPRYETVEREVNIDGKKVVVVPFRDVQDIYFESVDGNELTERVGHQMRIHLPKTKFVSALPIRKKYGPVELEVVPVEQLGEVVRADLVLVGNLKEFSTQEPKTTGILRGTCRVELDLYDVAQKRSIWRRSLTLHYPERGVGVPSTDTTPEKIREGLTKLTADAIAKRFYTYKKRFGPAPLDWNY